MTNLTAITHSCIEIDNPSNPHEFLNCELYKMLPFFKDDMASMEHPVFSLSTQPDKRTLHYEHNGNSIRIIPSAMGLPTIHDKDILIYCASHLRAAIGRGEQPSSILRFVVRDFFEVTGRSDGGVIYGRFRDTLRRLQGTMIETNIRTGRYRVEKGFGLIESWQALVEDQSGRLLAVEIVLSRWLYNAILSNELLTIHPDYFQLRKPIERRLYEIGRKHCGEQSHFKIGFELLRLKMASGSEVREFRRMIREIVQRDPLPDYQLTLQDDVVTFTHRLWLLQQAMQATQPPPRLKPATYEHAKRAAPGCDVYELERQWLAWGTHRKQPLKRPDSAFLAFCRKKGTQTAVVRGSA